MKYAIAFLAFVVFAPAASAHREESEDTSTPTTVCIEVNGETICN